MSDRSIGFRLTVWYAAVVSLALISFSLALRYTLARQLRSDLDESLLGQIRGSKNICESRIRTPAFAWRMRSTNFQGRCLGIICLPFTIRTVNLFMEIWLALIPF